MLDELLVCNKCINFSPRYMCVSLKMKINQHLNAASLFFLLHGAICIFYCVTPNDLDNTNTYKGHHCHNLQHYLLNITEYFTSNTQLLFLPGLHHLHTDLIIQNVHNISLIAATSHTVLQCDYSSLSSSLLLPVGVLIRNSFNLTIKNLMFENCIIPEINPRNGKKETSIKILNSSYVFMENVMIIGEPHFSIIAINVFTEFLLFNIKGKRIYIFYKDLNFLSARKYKTTLISIDNFTYIPQFNNPWDDYDTNPYGFPWPDAPTVQANDIIPKQIQWNSDGTIDSDKFDNIFTIYLLQNSYDVSINITNTLFHKLNDYTAVSINIKNCNNIINTVSISKCTFEGNNSSVSISLVLINIIICDDHLTERVGENSVVIENCLFYGNVLNDASSMIKVYTSSYTISIPHAIQANMIMHIISSSFYLNIAKFIDFNCLWEKNITSLLIRNTIFTKSFAENKAIILSRATLISKGPVFFSEISSENCLLCTNSNITFYNYVALKLQIL